MSITQLSELVKSQKEFFKSGETLSLNFRKNALKKLYRAIKNNESKICKALHSDLGKSEYESFMCEVGLVLSEISYMIKNLKRFAKAKHVKTPLAQFAAKSFKQPSPYGTVLIMSPWNYPILLTLDPIVDAIAAGNTAVVKPSAYSPATAKVVKNIISECFTPEYVAVITGGRQENAALLNEKFDMVFFTGSPAVGREVLRKTAENLTPVVLELGGKSPCVIDKTAKIKLAAKRIVFGKFLNCGQTCVAPDYVLCHKSVKDEFVKEVVKQIKMQYGEEPLNNPHYGKIINEKHFNRLRELIDEEKVVTGGKSNGFALKIEPTVLDNVGWDDPVMQEEIFGPILPIITFEDINEVFITINERAKPLAFYLFTEDKALANSAIKTVHFGGGCVNDVVIHLATSEMGFGGVGESGMGSYHGKDGFMAFSHEKSVVDKKTWMDLPMRYQPYKSSFYAKLIRLFLR